MCSLGSKIVQHGVDMSQLPNGRLAFYLANVGEDVDVVVTFLHVIYKLDAVADTAAGLKLSESTVRHALDLLKGHVEKTRAMKANLGECLRLLGEMNLDALVTILGGGTATKQPAEQLVDPPPAQSRALLSAPASVGSIVTSMEGAVTMSAPGTVRNAATTNAGAGTVTSSVTIPGEAGSVVNKPFFFLQPHACAWNATGPSVHPGTLTATAATCTRAPTRKRTILGLHAFATTPPVLVKFRSTHRSTPQSLTRATELHAISTTLVVIL